MKVKPVFQYRPPDYPTREWLASHPQLLHVYPNRWKENTVLIAMLTSASVVAGADGAEKKKTTPTSQVAPLFKHGSGNIRGAYGTTFSVLPVLLSEEDARQVIEEQLAKEGLDMSRGNKRTHAVSVTVMDPKTKDLSVKELSVTMDGSDSKHGVAYEFLSADDGTEAGGAGIELAEKVQHGLAADNPGGVQAIFYDPAPTVYEGMGPAGTNGPISGMKASKTFDENTLIPTGFFSHFFFGSSMTFSVENQCVSITRGDRHAVLTVGNKTAELNGKTVELPTPAVEYDGVIYLPFQALANTLDLKIYRDAEKNLLAVSFPVCAGRTQKADGSFEPRYVEREFKSAVTTPIGREDETRTFAFVGWDQKAVRAWAKVEAKRLLRLQAQDFVAWLKAQGVI